MSCRLCQICWTYWKRYGGLKVASRLADSGDIVDTTTTGGGGGGGAPPAVVATVVTAAAATAAGAGSPGIVSLKKTPQRVIIGPATGTGSAGSDIDDDLTIVASSGPIGSLESGGLSNHRPHR